MLSNYLIQNQEILLLKNKIKELQKIIEGNKNFNSEIKKDTYLNKKDIIDDVIECNDENYSISNLDNEKNTETLFCDFDLTKDENFFLYDKDKSISKLSNSFKLFKSAIILGNLRNLINLNHLILISILVSNQIQ